MELALHKGVTYPQASSEMMRLSEDVYHVCDKGVSAEDVRDRGQMELAAPYIVDCTHGISCKNYTAGNKITFVRECECIVIIDED